MRKGILLAVMTVLFIFAFASPSFAYQGDAEVNSPYFHYSSGDSGTKIPVDISFTNLETYEDYSIKVNRLDDNGEYREQIYGTINNSGSEGVIDFTYEFKDDLEEHGFPYEVEIAKEGQSYTTIMKGYVAEPPSEDFRSSGVNRGSYEAVGMGTVVYNSNGEGYLHDEENHTQVLTEYGDYMLLHYRFPSASKSDEHIIRIFDENNQEIELEISTKDIYEFQGNDDAKARRSFILVNTNGEIPAFVDDRADTSFTVRDNPFKAQVEKGVYSYELEDTVNNEYYKGESVWLVGENGNEEFNLYPERDSIREGYSIIWNVIRNTEEISEVYNRHFFVDIPKQEEYGNQIENEYKERSQIRYRVSDDIGVGEEGSVYWSIEKTLDGDTVVDWQNGRSGSEYTFTFKEDYEIRFAKEIEDALTDFLDSIGLSDEAGQIMFVMISIVAVSAGLAFIGAGLPVLMIANFGLIGVFALIGFIPLWLIIGLIMLAVMGLMIALKRE